MTTYTFLPKATTQSVNWSDPSVWVGGVVPNSADADVVFPTVLTGHGDIYSSNVGISGGQAYSVNSVSITNNVLGIDGSLSVANDVGVMQGGEVFVYGNLSVANEVTLMTGGEIGVFSGNLSIANDLAVTGGTVDVEGSGGSLSVSSLEISGSGASVTGSGQVNVSGIVSNNGSISGGGLTLTAAGLNNTGTLQANGSLTVNVNGGGFTNLSGSTLTGGTYQAGGQDSFGHPVTGTLDLNVGGLIISDAANIVLTGAISSFDNVSNSYVPLQSSLAEIASSGTLSLLSQTYNSDALTDDGTLKLYGATFTSPQLTINSDGLVSGTGTMTTTITNAGMIIAGHQQAAAER